MKDGKHAMRKYYSIDIVIIIISIIIIIIIFTRV